MYPKGRARSVDGPWKKTWEEAVDAYASMLERKELKSGMVFRPFLAEEEDKAIAPAGDGKHYYKERLDLTATIRTRLASHGVRLGP